MEIYWDEGEGQALTDAQRDLLTRALQAGLAHQNGPKHSEISLSFVTPNEIRQLNKDYRDKDSETDVLSFPVMNLLEPVPGERIHMPDGPPMVLGDIIICMDVARAQAQEYGHGLERELAFLAVHGLLHLLGHDHQTPVEEAVMCAAQDEILHGIGADR